MKAIDCDPYDARAVQVLTDVLNQISADGSDRVVVIVVTWNSRDHITSCLNSIQRNSMSVATLVVDNGSSDDSAALVEGRVDPKVLLVRTGRNLGYAGGNNVGLSMAREAGADFAVIVNPDATLEARCLNELVDAVRQDHTVGLASPAIRYANSDLIWYAGSEVNPVSVSSHHLHEGARSSTLQTDAYETGRASGCVMALALNRQSNIGLLDERYFLYFEETEWSLRMAQHGLRSLVVPSAVAWHDAGHGSGQTHPRYHYYMTRNRLLLASQYGSRGAIGAVPGTAINSLASLRWLARTSPRSLFRCALAMVDGYIDFFLGRFGSRRF